MGDGVNANDLTGQVAEVRSVLDRLGEYELICSGSHPYSQWYDQHLTDKRRYHKLVERTRWWGRNMMIWGIHVHVGIEERDKALPILDGLLAYIPHLQALSASSPYWAGVETGYASNRALMFQQLPTAGLPYPLADWAACLTVSFPVRIWASMLRRMLPFSTFTQFFAVGTNQLFLAARSFTLFPSRLVVFGMLPMLCSAVIDWLLV